MTLILRRVFYAKVGMAGPLVNHQKEAQKLFQKYGVSRKIRILTDYQSGRSDRVVVEWEIDDLREFDAALSTVASNAEGARAFNAWQAKLNDMIHYTEVDAWTIR